MLALKDLNNPDALDKIVVELSRKKETFLCHTMYLATIRKSNFKKGRTAVFPKMRGSGCTDWYNGARKHGQIDNGTSRKGTTGNSSDLCELRKEKEDDSR